MTTCERSTQIFFLSTSGMKKKKNDRGIFSASGCLFYCIAQVTHRYITLYRLCEGRRPKQSRQLDSRSGNMATTPEKTNVRGGIKKWQNTENVGAFPNWAANTSDASLLEHGPCMSTARLSILQHLCQTHTHTHRLQRKIRDKVELLTRHKSARLSRCTMFALWRATFALTVTTVKVAASLNDGDNYSILANIMWPHSWCLSY